MREEPSKPTILQVVPGLETGGVEITTLDIGDALITKGWNSLVASAGGRLTPDLAAGGSRHFELPLDSKNPYTIWRNASRLADLIRRESVSLIHARSRAPAWSALLAAKRTGIPFVTTYHGAYSQNNALKGWYNSVMARSDVVIANSQWTADLIASRNPYAIENTVVIHRGTDFEEFSQSAVSSDRRNALLNSWGLKGDEQVVVKLARLTGWKGQNVVIDAAARLAPDFPNLRFVLAGDAQGRSDYLQGLNDQIDAHGLQGKVLLPGHCNDPATAMALADIVTVASIDAEAFGRAAVEACALECPIVVSRIGAVGETIQAEPEVSVENRTGWKVPPGDAEALAETLRQILSMDEVDRGIVGKRARSYCKARFSQQQMCEKTLKVYEGLLRKI